MFPLSKYIFKRGIKGESKLIDLIIHILR